MDWLIRVMVGNQKAARFVLVLLPFMVGWTVVSVVFRWAPGILDTIKDLFANHRWEFVFIGVIPGLLMALCMTAVIWVCLWRSSGTIFEGLEP